MGYCLKGKKKIREDLGAVGWVLGQVILKIFFF